MTNPEGFSPAINQIHVIDRCYGTRGQEQVEKNKPEQIPGVNVVRAIPASGEIVIVSCNNINPETSQCSISNDAICPRKDLSTGNLPDSSIVRLFIPMADPGWAPRKLNTSNGNS